MAKSAKKSSGWDGVEAADLADVSGIGGVLPAGKYRVEVNKATMRTANSSGKEYVNLQLQISAGKFEGRYLFAPFYINSESANFVKGQKAFLAKFFLVCTGAVPDEFPETDEDLADLVGTECGVTVAVEDTENAQGNAEQRNIVARCFEANEVREEDEEAAAKPAKKKKPKPAPVEEEEEEEVEEEEEEEEEADDEEETEEEEEETEEEEEEEEEEEPARKKPVKKAAETRVAASKGKATGSPPSKPSKPLKKGAAPAPAGKKRKGPVDDLVDDIPF